MVDLCLLLYLPPHKRQSLDGRAGVLQQFSIEPLSLSRPGPFVVANGSQHLASLVTTSAIFTISGQRETELRRREPHRISSNSH